MKWLWVLLLIPYSSVCQTVHMEDDGIVYKGSVKTNASFAQLNHALEKALKYAGSKKLAATIDSSANEITISAETKLNSNQTYINTLWYTLKLTWKDNGYKYHIDSVNLHQKERGYETTIISSKQLVKDLDNTGPVASKAEKQMNEIDMRFQQLLDILRDQLKH